MNKATNVNEYNRSNPIKRRKFNKPRRRSSRQGDQGANLNKVINNLAGKLGLLNTHSINSTQSKTMRMKKPSYTRQLRNDNSQVGTASNSMTTKNMFKQYAAINTSYAKALVVPERATDAKIPGLYPIPTVSYHKRITVPMTVSAAGSNPITGVNSGNAAIIFNPFFVVDGTSTNSWLLLNNSSNLTLLTPEVTYGYTSLPINFGIPAGTFSAYRLVSCSFSIVPQMSLQTAQGTIAGGIMTQTGQITNGYSSTGNSPFSGNFTVASNIDNALYYHRANITALEGTRAIYFPFDPSFENFTPINVTHGATNSNQPGAGGDDFYFVYYITGAQSGARFNLEISYNIEFEPNVGNYTADISDSYSGNEVVQNVTRSLAKNKELIQQVSPNTDMLAAMEDCDFNENNSGTFFDNALSFIGDHSGEIMNISKAVIGALV